MHTVLSDNIYSGEGGGKMRDNEVYQPHLACSDWQWTVLEWLSSCVLPPSAPPPQPPPTHMQCIRTWESVLLRTLTEMGLKGLAGGPSTDSVSSLSAAWSLEWVGKDHHHLHSKYVDQGNF